MPVFSVDPNGELHLYQHEEPETGQPVWGASQLVGQDWLEARSFGGPDGRVYSIAPNGDLRRFRWNGAGWDHDANGNQYQVIDDEWENYLTPEYWNRVTVDERGNFYTVEPDGNLHFRSYDEATGSWVHRIADSGWGQFDLIVAAGDGVLYARRPDSSMYRFRYNADSQRWIQLENPMGDGWHMFSRIFSPGGDLLYGIRNDHVGADGQLLWYRYDEVTDTFLSGDTGELIGADWHDDYSVFATSDACKLTTSHTPQRPTVNPTSNSRSTVLPTDDGGLNHVYVSNNGALVHGHQPDINDLPNVNFTAMPGYQSLNGVSSAAYDEDRSLIAMAHGRDSDVRANSQDGAGGGWIGLDSLGGAMATPAALARKPDGTLNAFAVDGQGCLWQREQWAVNAQFIGWMRHHCGSLAAVQPMITQSEDHTFHLTLLRQDGRYQTTSVRNDTWGSWITLNGGGFTGEAATVLDGAGRLHLFSKGSDGRIYTQGQTASGFSGTWAPIPGLVSTGAPTAALAPSGKIEIAARGTDGYIYTTGQTSAGATTYRAWLKSSKEVAATTPTMAVSSNGVLAFTFRNELEQSFLYRATSTTAASRADNDEPITYVGGRLGK